MLHHLLKTSLGCCSCADQKSHGACNQSDPAQCSTWLRNVLTSCGCFVWSCRAAGRVSSTAAVGGQWANVYFKRTVDTTAEGIRRLTGTTLAVSTVVLHACQSLHNDVAADPIRQGSFAWSHTVPWRSKPSWDMLISMQSSKHTLLASKLLSKLVKTDWYDTTCPPADTHPTEMHASRGRC